MKCDAEFFKYAAIIRGLLPRLVSKVYKKRKKIFIHAKDTLNGNKRENVEFFYDDNGC